MELGAGEPGLAGRRQNLVDGLVAEDAEDGNAARRGHHFRRPREAHPPRTTSKNDAQIGGAGRRGTLGVLGPGQPADLDLSGHGAAIPARAARSSPAGSAAAESAVPTSTASAPAAAARSTSAGECMPLSATATRSAGTRASRSQASRGVDAEGVEVAAVDADDLGAGVERAVELGRGVDLDQRVERPPRAAQAEQRRRAAPATAPAR